MDALFQKETGRRNILKEDKKELSAAESQVIEGIPVMSPFGKAYGVSRIPSHAISTRVDKITHKDSAQVIDSKSSQDHICLLYTSPSPRD